MATNSKGSRGTPVSFHDGNTSKTCIVSTFGTDPKVMAQDMMEVAEAQQDYRYSTVPPRVSVDRQMGRIYVMGEGGNAKDVISAMVDAILPDREAASAALKAVA